MSGLAAVLGGRVPPGVYRWHGGFDAVDVRHAVELAGWRFGHLDGWTAGTRAQTLAGLGRALGFPDTYGQNLDALEDCLRDVPTGERGLLLLWDGWGALAGEDRGTFASVLDILRTRAEDPRRGRFSAVLRGDGPEVPGLSDVD